MIDVLSICHFTGASKLKKHILCYEIKWVADSVNKIASNFDFIRHRQYWINSDKFVHVPLSNIYKTQTEPNKTAKNEEFNTKLMFCSVNSTQNSYIFSNLFYFLLEYFVTFFFFIKFIHTLL